MKRSSALFALLPMALLAHSAFAQASALSDPRLRVPLNQDWSFYRGTLDPAQAAAATPPALPNGAQWERISIPHTWNALDGQDGGGNYHRGDGWYRRTLTITPQMIAPPAANVPGGAVQAAGRRQLYL
jgi:beta-galactosidase